MNEFEKLMRKIEKLVEEEYPSAEVSVVVVVPDNNDGLNIVEWNHIGSPSVTMIGALELLKTDILLDIESGLMKEEITEFEDEKGDDDE